MSVFRTSCILLKTLKTVPYVLKRSNTLIPQHLFDSIAVVVGYADSATWQKKLTKCFMVDVLFVGKEYQMQIMTIRKLEQWY